MKLICECLGGSHLYGLNTADSDLDYRGVFLNTKISQIIGLERFEHQEQKIGAQDKVYYELRRFLKLLRKTNSQVLELLSNNNWLEISDDFKLVQQYKEKLLDSEKFYKSLKGYLLRELKFANGIRAGKLGGKRKSAIEKYGFSSKNFVQVFRLCFAGIRFFESGHFPVNILKENTGLAQYLIDLKINPNLYNVKDLNERAERMESELDFSFKKRKINYTFDNDTANWICLKLYQPFFEFLT